jgi:hypothetical protein
MFVAAPKAFTVVAVVFSNAIVALPATMEVVKVGDVQASAPAVLTVSCVLVPTINDSPPSAYLFVNVTFVPAIGSLKKAQM